jgi:hypothetical protein
MAEQQIKTAPYMGYRGYGGGRITWEAHLKAWEGYAERYGYSFQSAETLAERGGFGAEELDEFYPDWKKHIIK